MRRVPGLILFLLLACASVTEARLGETLQKCIERYGPVIETRKARLEQSDPQSSVFTKSGITIVIEFRNEVAWNIRYIALDLIMDQVTELLKANMPEGGGWSAAYDVAGIHYRVSSDRGATAAFNPGRPGQPGVLELATRDFNLAWHKVYSARIQDSIRLQPSRVDIKKLDGF